MDECYYLKVLIDDYNKYKIITSPTLSITISVDLSHSDIQTAISFAFKKNHFNNINNSEKCTLKNHPMDSRASLLH